VSLPVERPVCLHPGCETRLSMASIRTWQKGCGAHTYLGEWPGKPECQCNTMMWMTPQRVSPKGYMIWRCVECMARSHGINYDSDPYDSSRRLPAPYGPLDEVLGFTETPETRQWREKLPPYLRPDGKTPHAAFRFFVDVHGGYTAEEL